MFRFSPSGVFRLLFLPLSVLVAGPALHAEVEELSLRESIERALAHNFDLRIEREDTVAAGGRLQNAEGAYVPDISLSATASHDESASAGSGVAETDSTALTAAVSGLTRSGATYRIATDLASRRQQTLLGTSETTRSGNLSVLEISQPLLRNRAIDSSRLAVAQGGLALDSSRAALEQRAMELVYAVESAYYGLAAARETVRVRESALAVSRRTFADTEARLQIGTLAPLDARSARAEVAAREADLIAARQQVRQSQNALLALLTDDYAARRDTELVTTDPLRTEAVALDYPTSAAHALLHRPELEQLDLALDSRRLSTRYERNQRLPQLDLSGSLGLNGAGNSYGDVRSDFTGADHPSYGVGLTLTLPWTTRRADGSITAARAAERQAELGLAKKRQTILTEVDNALTAAESAWQRIAATAAARDYAASALEAGRERLSAGETTAYQILQLQRDLTSAESDEIAARADYLQALAALRLSEASSLDHWHIEAAEVALPATAASRVAE